MITSNQNAKIQWVRKLQTQKKERQVSGCYVMEGIRLIEEASKGPVPLRLVLYTSPISDRGAEIIREIQTREIDVEEISASVMKSISDTESPQGILAVAESQLLPLPENPNFILILDAIHDPGNLGTLIRTAAAAAVDLILLAPDCADLFSPKVIRSGMGAHLRVPLRQFSWEEIRSYLQNFPQINILASDMEGNRSLWQQNLAMQTAIIIGSEAEGICKEAEQLASDKIFIPMAREVESLNAAIAAGVLMFEVVRQREANKK